MLPTAALIFVVGGCGNAASDDALGSGGTNLVEGSGGAPSMGGSGTSGGTDGDPSGGTGGGGRVDQAGMGGTTGSGSTGAFGGATGGAEPSLGGSQSGGAGQIGTGGAASTGGVVSTGGATSVGGQVEPETGGTAQTGGATGTGGATSTGGQVEPETGGTAQTGGTTGVGGQSTGGRLISFGTLLNPQAVVTESQQLAESLADPSSPQWQATGDQHRSYYFAEASTEEPYRLYVPTDWDGSTELPLVMFLHGAGSNESTYLDQNNGQMLTLAQQHGYVLVSPMGDQGAYGNFLRLTAPFGNEEGAAELMAQVTDDSELINERSEKDVINVLELVLHEYPIDRAAMFLTGHSMGSGGTWYIGGKYADYWRGLAPMSGPFVQESGYPWESVRPLSILVTEGTQTPSLDASRLLGDWLSLNGFDSEYLEVDADHGGMVSLVLPSVFDFFDRSRSN